MNPNLAQGVHERGEAELRVEHLGRQYAVGIRAVTLIPIAVVAIAAAESPGVRTGAIAVVCFLVAWSALYAVLVRSQRATLAGMLDALVLCGLGLITGQVTSTAWLETSRTWIRPFVMFAAVGYQYSIRWRVGVLLGLAVCTTAVLSAIAAQNQPIGPDVIVTVVWSNLVPMLARLLFSLLTRAARKADATAAETDRVSREQAVSERIRQEQRDISDSLHDTASTTLLMVALGQTGGAGQALRERARRDLETIRSVREGRPSAPEELSSVLTALTARSGLSVQLEISDPVVQLSPRVVHALVEASGEALTNVARHSGATTAVVRVTPSGAGVVVEVIDRGRGFEPAHVAPTRRGLRKSITARVASVGGIAEVATAVGQGTTVRLRWPR